jgi:hypothetical protein
MCSKQEGVLEGTYEISTMIRLDDNSWSHRGQEVRQLVLQPHLESKATTHKKNYCVGNKKEEPNTKHSYSSNIQQGILSNFTQAK